MTEESTLADFATEAAKTAANEGSELTDDASSATADEPAESTSERDVSEQPTPVTTYGRGEYTCADCGTDCTAVWRDGEELVCPTCKAW